MELTRNEQRAVVAEFLGMLFFVFTSCGGVVVVQALSVQLDVAGVIAIAFAHGLGILVVVAWTAGISGGHINPAVTIALLICRKVTVPVAIAYVIAQFAGAAAGAALLKVAIPNDYEGQLGLHALAPPMAGEEGLLMEIVLTAILVVVIFNTAVSKKGWGVNAPIAIGLTVALAHLVAVPWTGPSLNPARSFGPALVTNEWEDYWLYVTGPIIAAVLVGLSWLWFKSHGDELDESEPAKA